MWLDKILKFLGIDEFKLIMIVIFVLIIGTLIGVYIYRGYQVDDLKKDKVELQVSNASLGAEVATDGIVAKVNQDANVDLAKGTASVSAKHDKAVSDTAAKVTQTESSFEKIKNPTAEDKAKEVNATSTILINGLWEAYCEDVPTAQSCTIKQQS